MLLDFPPWRNAIGCRISLSKDRVTRCLLGDDLEGMGSEKRRLEGVLMYGMTAVNS